MSDREARVPGWDGSARTWRRYTREVSWYVRSTPVAKRRYCAHRLVSRLQGPARLLAMAWPDAAFDHADGVKEFLRRLASSPLVRQNLPNAAAICQQYFSFKKNPGESMQSYLVRESLCFAEFGEAITRLHEEKMGIQQHELDFGLPEWEADDERQNGWTEEVWNEDNWWEQYGAEDDVRERGADAAEDRRSPQDGHGDYGGSPQRSSRADPTVSRRSRGVQGSEYPDLSLTDSFVLGVFRGFRLLQGAGLHPEDMRDIIATTKR